MSRRKQSNPKPLKWDGTSKEGEEEGGPEPLKVENDQDASSGADAENDQSAEQEDESEDGRRPSPDPVRGQAASESRSQREGVRVKRSPSSRSRTPTNFGNSPESTTNTHGDKSPERAPSSRSVSALSEAERLHGDLKNALLAPEALLQSAGLPYLDLLPPGVRNEAARLFFMPPMLPGDASQGASVTPTPSKSRQPKPPTVQPLGDGVPPPTYECEPCNITFTARRTLEAHQTYYCAFRNQGKAVKGENDKSDTDRETPGSLRSASGKRRERCESSGEDLADTEDNNSNAASESGLKAIKTEGLYNCLKCPYTSDKKTSLNRHMRIHAETPVDPHTEVPNAPLNELSGSEASFGSRQEKRGEPITAADRYCKDCEIQFSSIKVFRVHKQYYCSTRHVLKAQQMAAAGSMPSESPPALPTKRFSVPNIELQKPLRVAVTGSPLGPEGPSSQTSSTAPASSTGSRPYVVLPTNPVIILPYSFLQGASMLPGNALPAQNALLVLPNGAVQCLPGTGAGPPPVLPVPLTSPSPHTLAAIMLGSLHAGNSQHGLQGFSPVVGGDIKDTFKGIRLPGPMSMTSMSRHASEESLNGLHDQGHGLPPPTLESPTGRVKQLLSHAELQPAIDLSVRTTSAGDISKHEEKMRAKLHMSSSYPSDEHLSADSENGSEKRLPLLSSTPVSSACSSPPPTSDQHHQTLNGFSDRSRSPMQQPEFLGRKTSGSAGSAGKRTPDNSSASSGTSKGSNKLNAANNVSAKLPGGATLTRAGTSHSLADLLLAGAGDLNELSRQQALQASLSPPAGHPQLLSALNSDLALRLLDPTYIASLQQLHTQKLLQQQQQIPHVQASQQGGVKIGISKCYECDIVFFKYDNYLVHKEHYCAATRNSQSSPAPLQPTNHVKKGQNQNPSGQDKRPVSSSPVNSSSPKSEINSTPSPAPPRTSSSQSRKQSDDGLGSEDLKVRIQPSPSALEQSPVDPSNAKEPIESPSKRNSQLAETIPCKYCGIRFSTLDTLQTHEKLYCRLKSVESQVAEVTFLGPKRTSLATDPENHTTLTTSSKQLQGYKCPCCDVYSPTMSAAQKHLETHSGIRAFKCQVCGYRGNTLRGMRSHIKVHFNPHDPDLQEADFIACIAAANDNENCISSPATHQNSTSFSQKSGEQDRNYDGILAEKPEVEAKRRRVSEPETRKSQNHVVASTLLAKEMWSAT